MTKTVSVIVPVYNAEATLHRCVDSILAQEYTQFELILVDDGSTDKSGTICGEYAARDSRVRVIHQQNGGAAAARNRGLQTAEGELLMFCDCDDMVSPMWISRLMALWTPGTMPMGSYCHSAPELGIEKPLLIPSGVPQNIRNYYDYNQAGIAGYLCNSIFDSQIVKQFDLRLREHRNCGDYNEDLLFVLQYAAHMQKIVYTGYSDYFYDTHEGSLSRSYGQFYFEKYQEKFWLWHDHIQSFDGGHANALTHLAESMMYHFLTAMHQEILAENGRFSRFRTMVRSDAVKKCLELSGCPKEDPRVIALLKQRASTLLWILLKVTTLKGRK